MNPLFFQPSLDQPAAFPTPPTPITPARRQVAAAGHATPGRDEGYFEACANPARNSRLPFALPPGRWSVLWRADLPSPIRPRFVFPAGDHFLIQDENSWVLLGERGQLVAKAGLDSGGQLTLDPAHGLFYHGDPTGMVSARRVQDGAVEFRFFAFGGKGWSRSSIARDGQRLRIVSKEPLGMTHQAPLRTPDLTVVETYDLGSPFVTDADRLLESAVQTGVLLSREIPLFLAETPGGLALAVRDHCLLTDRSAKIVRHLTGEFEPWALASDEAGRLYLPNRAGTRERLWVLSAEGELLTAVDLPAELPKPATPPLVGYDHRVYLLLSDRVWSVNLDGSRARTYPVSRPLAGATVTADDVLLMSDGKSLVALDAEGRANVLYVADEELSTPPILTSAGTLVVASRRELLCLGPK